jgi:hypothetical protein
MTRILNRIISELAFYELQMQANMRLVRQIREFMSKIDNDPSATQSGVISAENPIEIALKLSSRRLAERLTNLEADHRCISLEHSCHSKIAQSQLQIVRQDHRIVISTC